MFDHTTATDVPLHLDLIRTIGEHVPLLTAELVRGHISTTATTPLGSVSLEPPAWRRIRVLRFRVWRHGSPVLTLERFIGEEAQQRPDDARDSLSDPSGVRLALTARTIHHAI